MSKKTQNWAVPLIAILLGMLVGAVLMLIFGYDPFWATTIFSQRPLVL